MKLTVPCNWDYTLIDSLTGTAVRSLFGKIDQDHIGGGRASKPLRKVSREHIEKYIRTAQSKGLEFNYLLNSSCLGGDTFNKEWQQKLHETLDWVASTGTIRVTVSSPYLIEILKKYYPHIKISVSSLARINSLKKAQFYQDMGVDEIVLEYSTNRDFRTLELLRKKLDCNLVLMTNLFCLYQCPYALHHANINAHASQITDKEMQSDSFCVYKCTTTFINNPAEIIRSPWIRPEDLKYYEEIGIDTFKLVDRIYPSPLILRITNAYLSRKYDGNLLDLLNLKLFLLREIQNTFKGAINVEHLLEKIPSILPKIDNQKLTGFIESFKNRDCNSLNCSECKYCDNIADEVISFPNTIDLKQAESALKEAIAVSTNR